MGAWSREESEETEVTTGNTYSIPTNIMNHKIIIVSMRRYGVGSCVLLDQYLLKYGVYENGTVVVAGKNQYYSIKINNVGLITVLEKSEGLGEPFIKAIGIF